MELSDVMICCTQGQPGFPVFSGSARWGRQVEQCGGRTCLGGLLWSREGEISGQCGGCVCGWWLGVIKQLLTGL